MAAVRLRRHWPAVKAHLATSAVLLAVQAGVGGPTCRGAVLVFFLVFLVSWGARPARVASWRPWSRLASFPPMRRRPVDLGCERAGLPGTLARRERGVGARSGGQYHGSTTGLA